MFVNSRDNATHKQIYIPMFVNNRDNATYKTSIYVIITLSPELIYWNAHIYFTYPD